jgi:hypothetical protein
MKVPFPTPLETAHPGNVTAAELEGLEIEQLVSYKGTFDIVRKTLVPVSPDEGVRVRLNPSTWKVNWAVSADPPALPTTVTVYVPAGVYLATVKVAVPVPPDNGQTALLTGVPDIVQDVSVGVNPVSATLINVPGTACVGVGVAEGAASTDPRKAVSAETNNAMNRMSKVTA